MLQDLARRFRQWLGKPEVPLGDLADEAWQKVGPLPPARPLGLETPAPMPLELLTAAPPIPRDAQPRRLTGEHHPAPPPLPAPRNGQSRRITEELPPASVTPVVAYDAATEQREWQELLAAAKSRDVVAPRPARAAGSTRPEDLEWQAALARAKSGAARAVGIKRRPAREDSGDWGAAIAAAKRRAQLRVAGG